MRFAGFLLLALLCASAFAAPRAGKVVRVERRPQQLVGSPRYCTVSPSDNVGYCITNTPPQVGERITVLDNTRVLGTIRISTVTPLQDGCQQNTSWMTQGTLESGDLSTPSGAMIGVLDVAVDLRSAKLINVDKSPSGHAYGTDTIYAIDNNNDANPEVEFVQFGCDDSSNYSATSSGLCTEVYSVRSNKGLERIRTERVRTCY
ncbi:MAG TPA: hypothetical protein VL326_06895 [Kofleriaceae bacterium]|nr:hypothetical protein [Kofleriaceae bacterium]